MRVYPRTKKNGTKVYWASWTENKRTVRRSTRLSTKDAALRLVARWELARADPELAAAREATLGGEAVIYLRECRAADLSPKTIESYEQKLANVCDELGRDTPMEDITADRVARYFTTRNDEGASDSTQYKEWVCLRGVLVSARHRGRFHREVASLRPPRLTANYTPRKTSLTWKEADRLLRQLKGDRRRTVAYVLATGARLSEWMRAEGVDIDMKRGRVFIRGSKTDEAAAEIPIPAPMMRWLKIAGSPPFPAWGNARRDLELACKAAKVPRVTWNDLRRTFTSLLVQAGVPPHVLRHLTRHASTAMIDRVYGRQTTASVAELVKRHMRNTRSRTVTHRGRTRRTRRGPRGTRKH